MPPQHAVLFDDSGVSGDGLAAWAERTGRRAVTGPVRGRLRFAFYGRVSTEDHQDPVTSRARQRDQAGALVAGNGRIVAEYFDIGQSRTLSWARRPQAAALLAAMAEPDRGFDAIVIGEYERAFYGGQYAAMAPLFEHYGIQLWTPESSGPIDFQADQHEQMMLALGWQSKREITRTRMRVRTAMAAQTREQGRYLGGRPPYGYRLADAGPHPNKAHAAWGRRAHRLEPDPHTAPVVQWMFVQRLAGHSLARITRALNDAGIPCPSAADPKRNPHRSGHAWTLGTVAAILANPRYTGRQVWNRQRTDKRPDRPGQHRAGPLPGATVEPPRRMGHLHPARPPRIGHRGRLHRRPGDQHPARPRWHGHTPLPAGRADPLRDLRAQAGILLVQRPPGLPVPPRLHQRHPPRLHPGQELLYSRGPHPAPTWQLWPSCSPATNTSQGVQARPGRLPVSRKPRH
jgi:DNA invertase Pin-like site-specific DNA recombinase